MLKYTAESHSKFSLFSTSCCFVSPVKEELCSVIINLHFLTLPFSISSEVTVKFGALLTSHKYHSLLSPACFIFHCSANLHTKLMFSCKKRRIWRICMHTESSNTAAEWPFLEKSATLQWLVNSCFSAEIYQLKTR